MSDMNIIHSRNDYDACVIEGNNNAIANAAFYAEDTIEEATELMVGNSDLLLCIGLDISKEPNLACGCYDFQEEYAKAVATMVYEMMLRQ